MYTAKMKPDVVISAVVTRADGTIEDLGVIARTKQKQSWLTKILRRKCK